MHLKSFNPKAPPPPPPEAPSRELQMKKDFPTTGDDDEEERGGGKGSENAFLGIIISGGRTRQPAAADVCSTRRDYGWSDKEQWRFRQSLSLAAIASKFSTSPSFYASPRFSCCEVRPVSAPIHLSCVLSLACSELSMVGWARKLSLWDLPSPLDSEI